MLEVVVRILDTQETKATITEDLEGVLYIIQVSHIYYQDNPSIISCYFMFKKFNSHKLK